jgi:transposase InsO family protein
MTDHSIETLVETRKRVLIQVNRGELSIDLGAKILGISRQGLWKLRKKVSLYGLETIMGRKRGPKPYVRIWNRTPEWMEHIVEDLYTRYGVGPDRLVWLLDDRLIPLSRSTMYRVLIRRRLFIQRAQGKREKPTLYTKGYPAEEVQMDTTEPLGKSGPTLITAVDDYSRYGFADCYQGNKAAQAGAFLRRMVDNAPFPITAVRVDNGSEFHGAFKRTCKELGITIKRNPVRHPTSNGKVQRLHRTIEEECFWRVGTKPEGLDYARYWLSRYLAWYNTKRRHGGFGMEGRTPQQRIEDWILNKATPILYKEDVNETLILYKT